MVGGAGGQLPKKLLHKEKAPKYLMQCDSRKRNREQINGKNSLHTAAASAVRAAVKTLVSYRNDTIIAFLFAINKTKDSE